MKLKICQKISQTHCCFMSQNVCFPFLMLEQYITFSFCRTTVFEGRSLDCLLIAISTIHDPNISENGFPKQWINISQFKIYYISKITMWVNIVQHFWKYQCKLLIDNQIWLIAIARQPKYRRFYALVHIHTCKLDEVPTTPEVPPCSKWYQHFQIYPKQPSNHGRPKGE